VKSLTESPALLTVHESAPGHYVIRVRDTSQRPLIVGVTKLLPDASSLTVITPSDIKVFVSENGDQATSYPQPSTDEVTTQSDEADVDLTSPPPAEPDPVDEPLPSNVRRRKKPASITGRAEPCMRCQGHGKVPMMLDGGAAGESACPVCRGTGTMTRYGARR